MHTCKQLKTISGRAADVRTWRIWQSLASPPSTAQDQGSGKETTRRTEARHSRHRCRRSSAWNAPRKKLSLNHRPQTELLIANKCHCCSPRWTSLHLEDLNDTFFKHCLNLGALDSLHKRFLKYRSFLDFGPWYSSNSIRSANSYCPLLNLQLLKSSSSDICPKTYAQTSISGYKVWEPHASWSEELSCERRSSSSLSRVQMENLKTELIFQTELLDCNRLNKLTYWEVWEHQKKRWTTIPPWRWKTHQNPCSTVLPKLEMWRDFLRLFVATFPIAGELKYQSWECREQILWMQHLDIELLKDPCRVFRFQHCKIL